MSKDIFNLSGSLNPRDNPFENQAALSSTSFKDDGGPSITTALNDEDFLPRESLGILPNALLQRDSLTNEFLASSFKDLSVCSPRESLGILNLSSMDLGRESIGIFNINNQTNKNDLNGTEARDNLTFNDLQTTVISVQAPQIILNDKSKISFDSIADLDQGFLMPNSKRFSCVSSNGSSVASANPSFNSWELGEVSKISSISPAINSIEISRASKDILNEGFQVPLDSNNLSFSSYKSASSHYSFANDMENIRNRIQSLPTSFKSLSENTSFDEGLLCRGAQDELELDDSVFLQIKSGISAQTSINLEKSFDSERYMLDCTPQPDWDILDSSNDNSPVFNQVLTKEEVSRKVDKMFGTKAVDMGELSTQSPEISQNISKISKASQCSSTEFHQDLSKISHISEENLLKTISDMLKEKDNLSQSQKLEGQNALQTISNLLSDNANKTTKSEDSRHSSVGDPQQNDDKCEAMDLSLKNKSFDSHKSAAFKNPPPYGVYSPHKSVVKAINNSQGNSSNGSAKNSSVSLPIRRHSNISQNKANSTDKFKISKTLPSKREPLRAMLPVENMAKIAKTTNLAVTPENKLTLKSKKTSTPLQEPKLKPMAASTPTSRQLKENNNTTKPKLTRSFSYQPRTSLNAVANPRKSTVSNPRRNSVTEMAINNTKKDVEDVGVPRLKRSFSTGKESRILSALSKARQNMSSQQVRRSVDSLGDDTKKSTLEFKSPSKLALPRKMGKENSKP